MLSELAFDVVQGEMGEVKPKSGYIYLIVKRGLGCETDPEEIMGWEMFDAVRSSLGLHHSLSNVMVKLKNASYSYWS